LLKQLLVELQELVYQRQRIHYLPSVLICSTLFVLKTKEAEAIGNAVNHLNPDFKFSGVSTITANTNGFIAELNHQPGDYVQDGAAACSYNRFQKFRFCNERSLRRQAVMFLLASR